MTTGMSQRFASNTYRNITRDSVKTHVTCDHSASYEELVADPNGAVSHWSFSVLQPIWIQS